MQILLFEPPPPYLHKPARIIILYFFFPPIIRFPELFEHISNSSKDETYYEADVFGEDTERLKELQDWLKSLECSKAGKVDCGHKSVSEKAVKLIEEDLAGMVVSDGGRFKFALVLTDQVRAL